MLYVPVNSLHGRYSRVVAQHLSTLTNAIPLHRTIMYYLMQMYSHGIARINIVGKRFACC